MRAPDINDGADEEERERRALTRDEDCAGCEREGHTCADCRTADEIEAEARETADVAALGFLLCPANLRIGGAA